MLYLQRLSTEVQHMFVISCLQQSFFFFYSGNCTKILIILIMSQVYSVLLQTNNVKSAGQKNSRYERLQHRRILKSNAATEEDWIDVDNEDAETVIEEPVVTSKFTEYIFYIMCASTQPDKSIQSGIGRIQISKNICLWFLSDSIYIYYNIFLK